MAKTFNILLDGRSTDHDVLLKSHTTECDIYKSGTISNNIYFGKSGIDTRVYFGEQTLGGRFIVANIPYHEGFYAINRIAVAAALLNADVLKSLSRAEFAIGVGSNVTASEKISLLRWDNTIALGAEVTGARVLSYNGMEPVAIAVDVALGNLCYGALASAETAIATAAKVLGTSPAFSLGDMECRIASKIVLEGMGGQKMFQPGNALEINVDAAENVGKHIGQVSNEFVLAVQAVEVMRRWRLLSDMQNSVLADYDEMMLDDVDYITL